MTFRNFEGGIELGLLIVEWPRERVKQIGNFFTMLWSYAKIGLLSSPLSTG
jgi:hypothetical protein